MKRSSEKSFHYAWVIMGCCMLMSVANTIVSGTVGNFTKPVVTELGVPVSSFTGTI